MRAPTRARASTGWAETGFSSTPQPAVTAGPSAAGFPTASEGGGQVAVIPRGGYAGRPHQPSTRGGFRSSGCR